MSYTNDEQPQFVTTATTIAEMVDAFKSATYWSALASRIVAYTE